MRTKPIDMRVVLCAGLLLVCGFLINPASAQDSSLPPVPDFRTPPEPKPKIDPMEIYDQLPPDVQKELIDEVEYLYGYCEGRTFFALLHDCRCIASKAMEERILHPGSPLGIVAIGDRLADECPYPEGAAGYGYKSCKVTYAYQMPYGLEEFCTCFANRFAEFYKKQPNSSFSTVKNGFGYAVDTCEKDGVIGPNTIRGRF